MSLACLLANSVLTACFYPEYARFCRVRAGGTQAVQRTQQTILFGLLRQNAQTSIGKHLGFASIDSLEAYQHQVPLRGYEAYEEDIAQICNGAEGVLTREKPLLLEPTSGSSGAQKLIPYTATLKKQFQHGIYGWLGNLYIQAPELKQGKSYWSITPIGDTMQYTSGGLPIGFEEDGAYFGWLEQKLLNAAFAVDSKVARLHSTRQFYFETARALLDCGSLTLISVWNPTYFLLLLDYMRDNRASLLAALSPERAARIGGALEQEDYTAVWRKLRLVSCWCDANSASYARQLARRLPQARLQPKGLLSTEGFTTFPLAGEEGARLSVRSHFFEFLPPEGGTPLFGWQLKAGKEYEVVLTTGGGFYRYRTNDRVLVLGDCDNIPRLRFVGRGDQVCDLFGEKMNEQFVEQLVRRLAPEARFFLLAPDTDRYVLYLQTDGPVPALDLGLCENFHYAYCRRLGQLKPAAVFLLTGAPQTEYLEACVQMGQRLGDVKPLFLSTKGGWDKYFKGAFV